MKRTEPIRWVFIQCYTDFFSIFEKCLKVTSTVYVFSPNTRESPPVALLGNNISNWNKLFISFYYEDEFTWENLTLLSISAFL